MYMNSAWLILLAFRIGCNALWQLPLATCHMPLTKYLPLGQMGYNDRGQVNYRITHTPPARSAAQLRIAYTLIETDHPLAPCLWPCPLFMTVLFMCQLVSMSHNPPLHRPNWLFDYGLTYVCLSFRSRRLRWGEEGRGQG